MGSDVRQALVLNANAVAAGIETPVVLEAGLNRQLRPHQREGVLFMYAAIARGGGCILADTMGLGKTLQALALVWAVVNSGPGPVGLGPRSATPLVRKAIVVCPCSLCANWRAEVKKWLGDHRLKPTTVLAGAGRAKVESQIRQFRDYTNSRMLIISYEQLRQHVHLVDVACDLLICDEGHRLRSQGTATAKQLDAMRCRRRILLSGTPLQNDLDELFHCGRFVRPDLFPDPLAFHRLVAQPLVRSREPLATPEECSWGERAASELEALTSQFVLRRTSELLECSLPTRRELILRLRMAPVQVRAYRDVLAEFHMGSTSQDMARALKTMLVLRLLCNDAGDVLQSVCSAAQRSGTPRKMSTHGALQGQSAAVEDSSDEDAAASLPAFAQQELSDFWAKCADNVAEAARLQASTKSAVLVALLRRIRQEAPGDRVVIVSNFKRTLLRLQRLLSFQHIRISLLCGSTPAAKRLEIVNSLNMPGPAGIDVLLLSSKAGGVGLNLIGANRLVLFDPDWNPANDAQAMARIWREGQKKEAFIYRFVLAGTLEEKICQRQHAKADLAAISVDGISCALSSAPRLSWEELRRVFELEGYDEAGVPLSACMPSSGLLGASVPSSDPELGKALVDGTDLHDALLTVHLVGSQCPAGDCNARAAATADDADRTSCIPRGRPPATPQSAARMQDSQMPPTVSARGLPEISAAFSHATDSPRGLSQAAHTAISSRLDFLRRTQHQQLQQSASQHGMHATTQHLPEAAPEHMRLPQTQHLQQAAENIVSAPSVPEVAWEAALVQNIKKRPRTASTQRSGRSGNEKSGSRASRKQLASCTASGASACEAKKRPRVAGGPTAFHWALPAGPASPSARTPISSPDRAVATFLWSKYQ